MLRRAASSLIPGAILLGLIFLCCRSTLDNYFFGDDLPWLYHSAKMRTDFWGALWERWTYVGSCLSFFVDDQLFGTAARGYSATNLVLHLINVVVVGRLAQALTESRAGGLMMATLWGFNGQAASAILHKTNRGHQFPVLFFAVAILGLDSWRRTGNRGAFALSLAACTAAVLSLFNGVVLLPMVVLYLLLWGGWPRRAIEWRRTIATTAPFALIVGLYLVVFLFIRPTQTAGGYYSFSESLLIKFGRHLSHYVMSAGELLVVDYRSPAMIGLAVLSLAALVILPIVIRDRTLRFGIGWLVLTLAPFLPVPVGSGFQPGRYRYLPSVGFCLAATALLLLAFRAIDRVPVERRALRLVAILSISLLVGGHVLGQAYLFQLNDSDMEWYAEAHRDQIDCVCDAFDAMPRDRPILFANATETIVAQKLIEEMNRPQLMFVRNTAPWGLNYPEHLLSFCSRRRGERGWYEVVEQNRATERLQARDFHTLLVRDDGCSVAGANETPTAVLESVGDTDARSRATLLRYIDGKAAR